MTIAMTANQRRRVSRVGFLCSVTGLFDQHPFFWGVLLMLAASSLWALAFAAPLAIPDASAVEIALGRFIVYGLISLAALNLRKVWALPRSVLLRALIYALAGNVVYYFLLVLGIQWIDAALAVLVLGMLPVTVSLYGHYLAGTLELRRLAIPMGVFLTGFALLNIGKIGPLSESFSLPVSGLFCVLACLFMWSWYAVDNARFLKDATIVTATEWSSIIGIISLGIALIVLPLSWLTGFARNPIELTYVELTDIAIWSIILGAGATWLGTILFNLASKLLETPVLGQLIIFEAFFGLFYVFLFVGKQPVILEMIGAFVALLGIWLSIRKSQSS